MVSRKSKRPPWGLCNELPLIASGWCCLFPMPEHFILILIASRRKEIRRSLIRHRGDWKSSSRRRAKILMCLFLWAFFHGCSSNRSFASARPRGSIPRESQDIVAEWCPVLLGQQRVLSCCKTYQSGLLYSDDAVEELLLRLTEWLRPPWCFLLCLPLLSFAGSPWTTPFRASIPPLTEKFRHTMNARIAAFS